MDFGKSNDVGSVNFTLPPDHPDTAVVLGGAKKKAEIYMGGAKWGRKDWIGRLYPAGTRPGEMLHYYAESFNSIELNATHYNIPKPEIVKNWADQVDDDFRFCPKVFQLISHRMRLKNTLQLTEDFLDRMTLLGDKLGTIFLQMPPNFKINRIENLMRYLEEIPTGFPLALELRDPGWFEENNQSEQLFRLLKDRQITMVITDTSRFRELVHMRLTTREAFVRFVGNNLHPTDFERIDAWIGRIGEWLETGLERLWFFLHQHEEQYTPELAVYCEKQFREKLGIRLRKPGMPDPKEDSSGSE